MYTLLIDADDTLWQSNIYYLHCSEELNNWLVTLGIECTDIELAIAHFEQQVLALMDIALMDTSKPWLWRPGG